MAKSRICLTPSDSRVLDLAERILLAGGRIKVFDCGMATKRGFCIFEGKKSNKSSSLRMKIRINAIRRLNLAPTQFGRGIACRNELKN